MAGKAYQLSNNEKHGVGCVAGRCVRCLHVRVSLSSTAFSIEPSESFKIDNSIGYLGVRVSNYDIVDDNSLTLTMGLAAA